MVILRLFDPMAFDGSATAGVLKKLQQHLPTGRRSLMSVRMERCFYLEYTQEQEKAEDHELPLEELMRWLIKQPMLSTDSIRDSTSFKTTSADIVLEIGPRFNFSTPFSSSCVNIFHNLDYKNVRRMECSTRYHVAFMRTQHRETVEEIFEILGDRMTQCLYTEDNIPRVSFDERLPQQITTWRCVPLLEEGRKALEVANETMGLAFTEEDVSYYYNLFAKTLKRNPTSVELFDCAQSNSEHSRHWFFRGKMIIDGEEQPKSLMNMIKGTQEHTNKNNTIKFSDNSSAIKGFEHDSLLPENVSLPGPMRMKKLDSDLIFTAETHNMPTAVAPFSGATTGTGGRLRDVQGVGRGGVPIAGTAGYCVGALHIPGYPKSYEDRELRYPPSFSKPLQILIDASNGASDYGNKFGEPLISGFALSYGVANCAKPTLREEYVKPIMFSGGLGIMPSNMREKLPPARGMLLAKIGGPVYRIGVGGGAASSMEVQGGGDANLDFDAVQRGDAEMENKLNRVVRACLEMGEANPILAIHDQGAGGNGNVLKELVEPGFAGAIIFTKEFKLGDPTITALELWGAEYQENNAILCKPEDRELLEKICDRERCPISFVGVVTGDGRVALVEGKADFEKALATKDPTKLGRTPFNLDLKHVLGDMPKRTYKLERDPIRNQPLQLPVDSPLLNVLEGVLGILSVGSKRFLTNKVDRCVSGLVAQQQCVGPLHAPLADYGLTTVSLFSRSGIATSIGTQPLKGILDPGSMARLSVAEALSNLVFVKITEIADIKCSGNWMWAAKMPGEGAKMYEACTELCKILQELRIGIDGGKDSLSMAARVNNDVVKSPGTLVISMYAPCPDVLVKVTPDIKAPAMGARSALLWINIDEKMRLGGSALAQNYLQQGLECPTLERSDVLVKAFEATQTLLTQNLIQAGHDVSDGGLLSCLVEMAIGGMCGLQIDLTDSLSTLSPAAYDAGSVIIQRIELGLLFAEECGWVIEVDETDLKTVRGVYDRAGVPNFYLGTAEQYGMGSNICVANGPTILLDTNLLTICRMWEKTSFEIEKLQMNESCAKSEFSSMDYRTGPVYKCPIYLRGELKLRTVAQPIRVAVLREEGVNSDREMMACLFKASFEVHDVTMSDLIAGRTSLDNYRGVVFPGGFSYADTLGSAKGWAANILCSPKLRPQFEAFRKRKDVFSLGICNGCQLMTLLGWVGPQPMTTYDNFIPSPNMALMPNQSMRFECRWAAVQIPKNNAMMLRNMHDLILGVWTAHGEGRFVFKNLNLLNEIRHDELVAMQYVDDCCCGTELYPFNPNGSPFGIAGICSEDGRHLAIMPHPERCSSMHQWPYVPNDFPVPVTSPESPWQLMFNNAFNWCADFN